MDREQLLRQIEKENSKIKELEEKKEKGIDVEETTKTINYLQQVKLNDLQRELIIIETENRREQLEKMKDHLKKTIQSNNEVEIYGKISDIKRFMEVNDILEKMQISRYAKAISEYDHDPSDFLEKNFEKNQLEFKEKMSLFLRKFTLHQYTKGKMTQDEREQILSNDTFEQEDVERMFIELQEDVYGKQQANESQIQENEHVTEAQVDIQFQNKTTEQPKKVQSKVEKGEAINREGSDRAKLENIQNFYKRYRNVENMDNLKKKKEAQEAEELKKEGKGKSPKIDLTRIRDVDEMRSLLMRMRIQRFVEIHRNGNVDDLELLEQIKELERRVSLQEKEEVERLEKIDKVERIEGENTKVEGRGRRFY